VALLAGKSHEERAKGLVEGTMLSDPESRRKLVEGGITAVDQSSDPMIVFARQTDPLAREIRKWREENVESVDNSNGALIAKALFAVRGRDQYPDATFTLRLGYGPVKGYEEKGAPVPFKTVWEGMYRRSEEHGGKPPYDLPQSYLDARPRVDPKTPVNFVATADTTGGSSGSPAVNRKLELVGLFFDGNIQSLGNDAVYTEEVARSVCVHPAAMTAALRQVYGAAALADELEKGSGAGVKAPPRKESSRKK
jgi:hypothetical protein